MLKTVLRELDKWIENENRDRADDGRMTLGVCEIKVFGQTALIEAELSLHVPATMDVDVFANYEYPVKKKFEDLLKLQGKILDPVGHEAWMPAETEYSDFYIGNRVKSFLAKPEYVMIAKALKAPRKNKSLLIEYLASSPPELFFVLANMYEIDLGSFLE